MESHSIKEDWENCIVAGGFGDFLQPEILSQLRKRSGKELEVALHLRDLHKNIMNLPREAGNSNNRFVLKSI